MKYEGPRPITREDAATEIQSADPERITAALLRLSLHDPDPQWLQGTLLPHLGHAHASVRAIAALCVGHVARLHRAIDRDQVVPAVRPLLADPNPETRAKAADALADIEMFAPQKPPM